MVSSSASQKGKIAEVPIAAGIVLDPAPVDSPIVHLDSPFRDVLVLLRAPVRRGDSAEIDTEGLPQSLGIIRRKAEVSLQASIDSFIARVVDRNAIGFPAGQGRVYSFF